MVLLEPATAADYLPPSAAVVFSVLLLAFDPL
jgi:hypothetical protein